MNATFTEIARNALALVLVIVPSCSSSMPASPIAAAPPPATSPELRVHHFSNNWGNGPGCTPKGTQLSLSATLVVLPFGKGTDGAVVRTETDDWVVSYRADGALLGLHGKRVRARGRACDKQGGAVRGPHFDLSTLVEL